MDSMKALQMFVQIEIQMEELLLMSNLKLSLAFLSNLSF